MSKKRRYRRYVVSIDNRALRKSEVYTVACRRSLPVLAIICEQALAAGFTDLMQIYQTLPEIVEKMCNAARIAVRGLRRLEGHQKSRDFKKETTRLNMALDQ